MLKITCNACKKCIEIANCKILQNSIDMLKPYTVLTTALPLTNVIKKNSVSSVRAGNMYNKAQFYDYAGILCHQCKKKIAICILNSANFIFHCFKDSILTYVYLLSTKCITISYFNDAISPLKCSSTTKIIRSISGDFKCKSDEEIKALILKAEHIHKALNMIKKMNNCFLHIMPTKRKNNENINTN